MIRSLKVNLFKLPLLRALLRIWKHLFKGENEIESYRGVNINYCIKFWKLSNINFCNFY